MAEMVGSLRAIARLALVASRPALSFFVALTLGLALAPVISRVAHAATGSAGSPQQKVPAPTGIRNFGRVTPMLYRGGDFIPGGLPSIVALGVRTVICVRSHSRHGEPDSLAAHGIAYHLFPMTTAARPNPAAMDSILDIIRNAKAPVYVHCTAGEHRTGTICALYRIRVQGWSRQRAWAEQEAYGFGPPSHHPNLFHFVYGDSVPLTP